MNLQPTNEGEVIGSVTADRVGGVRVHFLKCWPKYFSEVIAGRKPWEIRLNDRAYKAGDHVCLQEFDPEAKRYSGASALFRISYILHGGGNDAVPIHENFCIMTLDSPDAEAIEFVRGSA